MRCLLFPPTIIGFADHLALVVTAKHPENEAVYATETVRAVVLARKSQADLAGCENAKVVKHWIHSPTVALIETVRLRGLRTLC